MKVHSLLALCAVTFVVGALAGCSKSDDKKKAAEQNAPPGGGPPAGGMGMPGGAGGPGGGPGGGPPGGGPGGGPPGGIGGPGGGPPGGIGIGGPGKGPGGIGGPGGGPPGGIGGPGGIPGGGIPGTGPGGQTAKKPPGHLQAWTTGGGLLQIDKIYMGKPQSTVLTVFGEPNSKEVDTWVYQGITVQKVDTGQKLNTIRFTFTAGNVSQIVVAP